MAIVWVFEVDNILFRFFLSPKQKELTSYYLKLSFGYNETKILEKKKKKKSPPLTRKNSKNRIMKNILNFKNLTKHIKYNKHNIQYRQSRNSIFYWHHLSISFYKKLILLSLYFICFMILALLGIAHGRFVRVCVFSDVFSVFRIL